MSRLSRVSTAVGLLLVLGGCGHLIPAGHQSTDPADLFAGAYRLDPNHVAVLFKLDHLGFSQLVGRFERLDASLDFDPAEPETSRLAVVIDAASLRFGLPDFEATLRGPDYFDTARFPQIRFESTGITVTGPDTGIVTGSLTMKGITQPLALQVTFNGGADNPVGRFTLGFAASGSLDRRDFDLGRFAPAVGATVTLEIHAEFLRQTD